MRSTVTMRHWKRSDRIAGRTARMIRIGSGLVALRKRRRMSRKDLANLLRVSPNRLGFWERGEYPIPSPQLCDLCEYLKTSLAELLAEGKSRRSTYLQRHRGLGGSERRRTMSNETNGTEAQDIEVTVGTDPGVGLIEPDLKSERLQEESVAPDEPLAAVSAASAVSAVANAD